MNEPVTKCPSCSMAIDASNPRRKCSLCGWRACRKCAATKFCPDCKRATMDNDASA